MSVSSALLLLGVTLHALHVLLGMKAYTLRTLREKEIHGSDFLMLGNPAWPFYNVYSRSAGHVVHIGRILTLIIAILYLLAYVMKEWLDK